MPRRLLNLCVALAAFSVSAPGFADKHVESGGMAGHENMKGNDNMQGMDMQGMDMKGGQNAKPGKAQVHRGKGTVTKVDAKAGKVGIKHGPIATMNWPAMTMDFTVKDKAILKKVKPGDKIAFDMRAAGAGQYVVTRIAPAQ